MPYGTIKVDTITFTDGGIDKSVSISGLTQNPTFTGNVTVTGTVSGATVRATTVSGVTISGTTVNAASGVFTTQISGAVVVAPAGLVGTPSVQVGTGATVAPGLYGAGTDQLGISTAGSSRLVVDSVGQIRVVTGGSETAPALVVGNDINTGIYAPGADQVAISTNGVGRLFVDASGNVGLGITPVANTLLGGARGSSLPGLIEVAGNGNTVGSSGFAIGQDGSGVATLFQRANAAMYFATNGTERLRITSAGLVGVGTSSPNTLMHLFGGDLKVQKGTDPFDVSEITFSNLYRTGRVLSSYTDPVNSVETYISFHTNRTGQLNDGVVEAMRIAGGRVGIGNSIPGSFNSAANQLVIGNGSADQGLTIYTGSSNQGSIFFADGTTGGAQQAAGYIIYPHGGEYMAFGTANAERVRITSTGLGIGTTNPGAYSGQLVVNISPSGDHLVFSDDATSNGAAAARLGCSGNNLVFKTNSGASAATERARIDSSGRLLVGTSTARGWSGITPQFQLEGLDVNSASASFTANINSANGSFLSFIKSRGTALNSNTLVSSDDILGALYFNGADGTGPVQAAVISAQVDGTPGANDMPGRLVFSTTADGGSSPTERLRIDSSGRLLVGTSSALTGTDTQYSRLVVTGNTSGASAGIMSISRPEAATSITTDEILGIISFADSGAGEYGRITCAADANAGTNDYPGRLVFSTTADGASSPTERLRITQNGTVGIGKTTNFGTIGTDGCDFGPSGYGMFVRNGDIPLYVNRKTSDGVLVSLFQDSVEEGTISVSGTTVSYNGAHLSRWSQIEGIDPHDKTDRPEILRGTVMSNLDEMCDWIDPESGDVQDNEQLNKTKVSNVEGDKNVAGVFQAWDDDDDTWVNDYYLAMTGDFIIRIGAGVTVERGDLLMSAGDGTAKPQDDDIIRSKTIAKVTSTNVSCTYDDGSYCVPCVLMAC